MGLPAALKAHSNGDLKTAALHYQRALDQGDTQAVIFQNFGALLRETGDLDRAEGLYQKGMDLHPLHRGIRRNRANLLRESEPLLSFKLHFDLLREAFNNSEIEVSDSDINPLIDILESLGYRSWAYQFCRWSLSVVGPQPSILLQLFKLITSKGFNIFVKNSDQESIINSLNDQISSLSPSEQAEYYFSLMSIQLQRHEFNKCLGPWRWHDQFFPEYHLTLRSRKKSCLNLIISIAGIWDVLF